MDFLWKWLRKNSKIGSNQNQKPALGLTKLRLEQLEDRVVPSGFNDLISNINALNQANSTSGIEITSITPSESEVVTDATEISIEGNGVYRQPILVQLDGRRLGRVRPGKDGTWNKDAPGLEEGIHTLTLIARRRVAYGEYSFVVDQWAPELLFEPQKYVHSAPTSPIVKISVQDEGLEQLAALAGITDLTVDVSIDVDLNRDGDFEDDGELEFSVVAVPLGRELEISLAPIEREGRFNIRANIKDLVGHETQSSTFEVIVPNTQPGPNESTYPLDRAESLWSLWLDNNGGKGGDKGPGKGGNFEPPEENNNPGGVAGVEDGVGDRVARPRVFFQETEPNDSPATSNPINPMEGERFTIQGTIDDMNDFDGFVFTITQRSGIFFDVDSFETGLAQNLDTLLFLAVQNGNNITVTHASDAGYDFDTGFPFPFGVTDIFVDDPALYVELNPGTYHIVIGPFAGSGDYEINIDISTNFSSTVPAFETNPGAANTFYLDFNGDSDTTPAWNGGNFYNVAGYDFNGNPNEYSPGEQKAIENIVNIMGEDFSPFDVNITTVDPGTITDGESLRVVFTNDPGAGLGFPGVGILGVAILGAFNDSFNDDDTLFIFAPNFDQSYNGGDFGPLGASGTIMATAAEVGNTGSHEVGHTLDLEHYGNNNDIPDSIMRDINATLNRELWARGLTSDGPGESTPFNQDDLAVLAGAGNSFEFLPDDHGDNIGSATPLTANGTSYTANGVIDHPDTDTDFFEFFGTDGGTTEIRVIVDNYVTDLDVVLNLYDSDGNQIGTDNPSNSFGAALNVSLTDDFYYVEVRSDASPQELMEIGQFLLTIETPQEPMPPIPPPPGGGDNGIIIVANPGDDALEPNDVSDQATVFNPLSLGDLQSLSDLSINQKNGVHDHDWFRWTVQESGTFNFKIDNIRDSDGDLHLKVFRLNTSNNTLDLLGFSNDIGLSTNQEVDVEVAAGDIIFGYVFGYASTTASRHFSVGMYDMEASLT